VPPAIRQRHPPEGVRFMADGRGYSRCMADLQPQPHGGALQRRRLALSDAEVAAAIASGLTQQALADQCGISRRSIRDALARHRAATEAQEVQDAAAARHRKTEARRAKGSADRRPPIKPAPIPTPTTAPEPQVGDLVVSPDGELQRVYGVGRPETPVFRFQQADANLPAGCRINTSTIGCAIFDLPEEPCIESTTFGWSLEQLRTIEQYLDALRRYRFAIATGDLGQHDRLILIIDPEWRSISTLPELIQLLALARKYSDFDHSWRSTDTRPRRRPQISSAAYRVSAVEADITATIPELLNGTAGQPHTRSGYLNSAQALDLACRR
jgi:hypothetical protein